MPPAAASMRAIGSASAASSAPRVRNRSRRTRRFGPSSRRRRAASVAVRPRGVAGAVAKFARAGCMDMASAHGRAVPAGPPAFQTRWNGASVAGAQVMDRVRLLDGGEEAFPRMLEAIRAARRTVRFESYIFGRDAIGLRFIEELCAAARRGVEVTAVLDGFGSPHAFSIAGELRAAGARVRVHGRLLAMLLGRFLRNHRKLLLVDGEVAFAGGINISAAQARWADVSI